MAHDVLFTLGNVGHLRHYEAPIRMLARSGHRVRILIGESHPKYGRRALESLLDAAPSVEAGRLVEREWSLRGAAAGFTRGLRGTAAYLKPRHPMPARASQWGSSKLRFGLGRLLASPPALSLLSRPAVERMLARVEAAAAPSRRVVAALRARRPDVVVAAPFIFGDAPEVEYVKAAKALGIPTAVAISSWDNLTTKGTFPLQPDLVLLWNAAMAREAVTLHDVAPDRVVVTGAQTFDYWFELGPTRDRAGFCATAGIDAARPYLLYLCSSGSITGDETGFVRELVGALRRLAATRELQLLIRPHPTGKSDWSSFDLPGVVVWPRKAELVDDPASRSRYVDTLHHAVAAVGVNTSAMLEAAASDRPCLTILAGRYAATQTGRAHFKHLLDGGFLEVAQDFDQAVPRIAALVGGADSLREARRRFVCEFLRPHGLERPAAEPFARAVEMLAAGAAAHDIQRSLAPKGEPADAPLATAGRG